MPVWLEIKAANDTRWAPTEDLESLAQAEERARAMIVCGVVTPQGIHIVWSPDAYGAPRARALDAADWGLLRAREDLAG